MKNLTQTFLLLFAVTLTAKEPLRTWTSSDGRTLEARYLEIVGSKVRIENASGRKFTVPLTGFSSADQEYVKQAYGRSLFAEPQPFKDEGRGGVIVASAKGKVEVVAQKRNRYSDKDPDPRAVIVGESVGPGTTLITGSGAEADLLLTNGTLVHLGEDTKLVLTALYQKAFKGTSQKASELIKEVSPSRTALKLEEGDLVLEVRKLGKESSFLVETNIAQAGIRGTQFKVSASADSAELAVLEGRVDFLDAEQLAAPVETAKKAGTRKGVPAKLEDMSASEQAELKQVVEQTKGVSASIDLNRLANTVDGYAAKPNYIVKSALNMELIWCPPGGYVRGLGDKAHQVILTKGFYLGKHEVRQEQYRAVSKTNPSHWKGRNLPVEHVSWNDAIEFLKIINQKEQKPNKWAFSLPTEAEWEYACRAGTITINSWGDSPNPDFAAKFANLKMNGINKTVLIGSYRPNQWGFYDMHGNVHEWCFDYFGEYTTNLKLDPKGPIKGKERILRGGAYDSLYGQSGVRLKEPPNHRSGNLGFRVALKQVD